MMDDFRLIQEASNEMKSIEPLFADYERREGIYSELKWRSRFANRSFDAKLRYCFGLTLLLALLWLPLILPSTLKISIPSPIAKIVGIILQILLYICYACIVWIWGSIGRYADYSPAQLLIMNRYFKTPSGEGGTWRQESGKKH